VSAVRTRSRNSHRPDGRTRPRVLAGRSEEVKRSGTSGSANAPAPTFLAIVEAEREVPPPLPLQRSVRADVLLQRPTDSEQRSVNPPGFRCTPCSRGEHYIRQLWQLLAAFHHLGENLRRDCLRFPQRRLFRAAVSITPGNSSSCSTSICSGGSPPYLCANSNGIESGRTTWLDVPIRVRPSPAPGRWRRRVGPTDSSPSRAACGRPRSVGRDGRGAQAQKHPTRR
jgi:hypothetical protein